MRTAVTALALLGLLCGSAAAADVRAMGPAHAVSAPGVQVPVTVVVQREVREALLDASLTNEQMTVVFRQLDSFVRNYSKAVAQGDPATREHSLEEYLASKVVPHLEAASLSTAEVERVLTLTTSWVDLEITQPDVSRLDREVRR